MENTIKMQRLNAAAEKAENTINRAQNWEANRNNAAARLFAINAAAAIIEGRDTDNAAADYLHGLFISTFNAQVKARAAFDASFSAIKAAANLQRAENWQKVTAERAERAAADGAKKSKNAQKRAARAAERAAALRAKIG